MINNLSFMLQVALSMGLTVLTQVTYILKSKFSLIKDYRNGPEFSILFSYIY